MAEKSLEKDWLVVKPQTTIDGIAWCEQDHVWRACSIPQVNDRVIHPMECVTCKQPCVAFVDDANAGKADTPDKRRRLLQWMKRDVAAKVNPRRRRRH